MFWVVTYHWCPTQPRTLLLITFGRTTFLLPITIYQLLGGKTSSIKLNEPFECLVFIKTCFYVIQRCWNLHKLPILKPIFTALEVNGIQRSETLYCAETRTFMNIHLKFLHTTIPTTFRVLKCNLHGLQSGAHRTHDSNPVTPSIAPHAWTFMCFLQGAKAVRWVCFLSLFVNLSLYLSSPARWVCFLQTKNTICSSSCCGEFCVWGRVV